MRYDVYIVFGSMVVFGTVRFHVVSYHNPVFEEGCGFQRSGIMDADGYARARIRVGAHEKKQVLSTLFHGGYEGPIRR